MTRLSLIPTIIVYLAFQLISAPPARGQERAPAPLGYVLEIGRAGSGACRTSPMSPEARQASRLFTVSPSASTPPAGGKYQQASAVTVRVAAVGDGWDVEVGVQSGEFYDGARKQVAAYRVHTNERVEINEVAPFGAAPFTVAVMKVLQGAARTPQVLNKTQSVSVEKLEPARPPSPFSLSLKNLSGKDVLALEVNTLKGGRRLGLRWPEGRWLEPLIKPGGAYHIELDSTDESCGGAKGYLPGQADAVEINTVVFADGSYEGASYLAALTRARALGYERQLGRVLEALGSLIERADPTAFEVAAQLKEMSPASDETVDAAALDEFRAGFPSYSEETIARLGEYLRHSLREVERDLLADVKRFEAKAGEGQVKLSARSWLEEMKGKYARRLAAARAVAHAPDAGTK